MVRFIPIVFFTRRTNRAWRFWVKIRVSVIENRFIEYVCL